ncbi:heavy metal translocating P-type ATPase [Cupriavidus basilensis]|uniref:heavy metal translocating P-type ATPase n=1 Tax=Cupriavidus basilensis TaxID=68895 RepID=UPI00157B0AE5|nr:heavy metal translocating P-type ATPase [Cupriavidus basilensis]NUA28547.1 heavy metal translocating P-type ATPase [Cupriavidus basilensis]
MAPAQPRYHRWLNLGLLATCALTLSAGSLLYWFESAALARTVWLIGVLPVLIALAASTVLAAWRRKAGMDVLALLAIGFAWWLGEHFAAAVIALMLASGRALESYAQARAASEMSALLRHAPREASRFERGEWRPVPLELVRPGDRLLVRAGEVVPADGTLLQAAELDESTLTGEAMPLRRAPGEPLRSGVVNAGAPFEMLAGATAAQSTYSGIVRLVMEAQQSRSPSMRLADRYALLLVPLALAVAGAAWIMTGDAHRALAVLVVATPCPLILAVPVAIVCGMSRAASRGILVKSGGALERLAQCRVLFFDKTGTLTTGQARVSAIEAAPGHAQDEVLRLAASLAQASVHASSRALVAAARERGLALVLPREVAEDPGAGLRGRIGGHVVSIGSLAHVASATAPMPWSTAWVRRMGHEGASAVFLGVDGAMRGALQLADQIRLDTPRALRLLRQAGIQRMVMLTGDRDDVAQMTGAMLGVTQVRAQQTPAQKLAAIREAQRNDTVIMVGDGVNDAPALAAADVGVAMGAAGAAASAQAADVVLLVDRLDRLAEAMQIARRTRRIAVQSVVAGMALSLAAMIAAAFGYLPPLAGALLQELIDVVVILNALRARNPGPEWQPAQITAAEAARLKTEHSELGQVLDQVRSMADRVASLPGEAAAAQLAALNQALREQLLAHEIHDDADLYPELARRLGGKDPLAALSGGHREIFHLVGMLERIAADQPAGGIDLESAQEVRRLLYELNAILRLHFAQEDELYHALGDA